MRLVIKGFAALGSLGLGLGFSGAMACQIHGTCTSLQLLMPEMLHGLRKPGP